MRRTERPGAECGVRRTPLTAMLRHPAYTSLLFTGICPLQRSTSPTTRFYYSSPSPRSHASLTDTRIHILSDLHLAFAPFAPPAVEADVVVLAGDTDVGLNGVKWA